MRNLAKIYNYDPNYKSPVISPNISPVSMRSKSMTMRGNETTSPTQDKADKATKAAQALNKKANNTWKKLKM